MRVNRPVLFSKPLLLSMLASLQLLILAGCNTNGQSLNLPEETAIRPKQEEAKIVDKAADPKTPLRLGQRLIESGNYAAAIPFFERVLADDAEDITALRGMIAAYRQLDQPQDLMHYYTRLAKHSDAHVADFLDYGRLALRVNKPGIALLAYQAADAKRADSADDPIALRQLAVLNNGMGISYDFLGQGDLARQAYQRGLAALDTSNLAQGDLIGLIAKLRNNLALSLAISGQNTEAQLLIETLLETLPATDQAHRQAAQVNLALIHGLNGNDVKAAQILAPLIGQQATNLSLQEFEALRREKDHGRKAALIGTLLPALQSSL